MTTRILIADDHAIMRAGLRSLLEAEPAFEVVGEAENGREAVAMALALDPDVLVMDIGMPDLNGIEATRQLAAERAGIRVLALSMHSDRRFVKGMLAAGAAGYVLKSSAAEELVAAIRAVSGNRIYTSAKITDLVMEEFIRQLTDPEPRTARASPLSPREREVLQLLAEGASTKEIAGRLHVSANTVDTHRRRIMGKLDLHSVAELTKFAIREGLTSLDP